MKNLVIYTVLLCIGLVTGMVLDGWLPTLSGGQETALEHAKKHLDPTYVCPMHSEITGNDKGSCPICGMDLVPIKSRDEDQDTDEAHPVVSISPDVINNLGVRVAQVERATLTRQIETPGYVQTIQKEKNSRFTAPAAGRIKKFHFGFGQWMHKGDALVDLELNDLVKVQQAHLAYIKNEQESGSTDADGGANAREVDATPAANTEQPPDDEEVAINSSEYTRRLMFLAGMTEDQVTHLEATGETSPLITLYAGHEGTVLDLKLNEGDEVESNEFMFNLGGLVRVTVLANAFQRDATWIQSGQPVDIILPNEGGDPIKGVVLQGAVSINNTSQNIGVKLAFTAPLVLVKSGMYVVGHIYGRVSENALSLPREAIIYTENETRVIEALGKGRFKPVVVKTGISTKDRTEILEGLEEGDTIVVSAQFLIDSESSLRASYRRMTAIE